MGRFTVSNLERSLEFYQSKIGFRLLEKDESSATLTVDGENVILSIIEVEKAVRRPYQTTGMFHLAILVPTRADLANVIYNLSDKDFPIHGATDHIYSEAIYLSDPDQNGIDIYTDKKLKNGRETVEEDT